MQHEYKLLDMELGDENHRWACAGQLSDMANPRLESVLRSARRQPSAAGVNSNAMSSNLARWARLEFRLKQFKRA